MYLIGNLPSFTGEAKIQSSESLHIPLITEPCNSQLRSLLEKIEVDRMIEMLTTKDWLKLQKFADFRVRGLGGASRGRTGEDLLGDALLRTLIGAESTQKH